MDDILFVVLMSAVGVGLVLTCGALYQIRRQGFEQAMANGDRDTWSIGRILFVGALVCFGIAIAVSFID